MTSGGKLPQPKPLITPHHPGKPKRQQTETKAANCTKQLTAQTKRNTTTATQPTQLNLRQLYIDEPRDRGADDQGNPHNKEPEHKMNLGSIQLATRFARRNKGPNSGIQRLVARFKEPTLLWSGQCSL
jgi:hypothetical protein